MFRSKLFEFALLASVLGNPAQAENIYLNLGDSIVRGHDVIYCGVQSPPILQSATSTTCGRESGYDGSCIFFNFEVTCWSKTGTVGKIQKRCLEHDYLWRGILRVGPKISIPTLSAATGTYPFIWLMPSSMLSTG